MDSQNEDDEELKYQPPDYDVSPDTSVPLKTGNYPNVSITPQYTSLQINHSSVPHHRGKQKSFQSLATELTHYTRESTALSNATIATVKYSEIASVVSAYSSYIPQENDDLLQIDYVFDDNKQQTTNVKLFKYCNIILFIICYILLFIGKTCRIGRYLVLIMSLSLSLIYTMKPSYISMPIPCLCSSHSAGEDAESYNNKKQETILVTVRKFKFPLDQATLPIICVLLLIASKENAATPYFTWNIAATAMIGKEIKPWAVLGILFGLCYLCITLDLTGILKGLAKKTADSSDSYSTRLFLYIFLFAAILTIITNNDISIICLTPLVCSTANAANIDATPFVFMVLFTSNTFSMLLITGNPANLIVTEAANLQYLTYLKYMIVPTIISGTLLYAELYLMFKKKLRKRFQTKLDVKSWRELIKLPKYAMFCACRLFLACIGIPIVDIIKQKHHELLNKYPLDMFIVLGIAVPSVIIDLLAFDIRILAQFPAMDYKNDYDESLLENYKKYNQLRQQQQPQSNLIPIDEKTEDVQDDMYISQHLELSGIASVNTLNSTTERDNVNVDIHNTLHTLNTVNTRVTHDTFQTYDSNALLYDKLNLKIETFALDALWELPWKLIPFVFGLFIIVGFMGEIGLVDGLADMLINISNGNQWIAMFVVGLISTTLCQLVNNQPMTVLLSAVLTNVPNRNEHVQPEWLVGAYFALAIGANLGGNATPIASLAVLMWRGILAKWNIHMQYIGFSKRGILVTPILVVVCILVVAIEDIYLFK